MHYGFIYFISNLIIKDAEYIDKQVNSSLKKIAKNIRLKNRKLMLNLNPNLYST
jgi:ABC-type Fe3+-citrate transport system substrate-binding protein